MIWSGANGNGHQRTAMVRFIMPELELGTMVEVSTLVVLVVVVMIIIMVVVVVVMMITVVAMVILFLFLMFFCGVMVFLDCIRENGAEMIEPWGVWWW